jgi:uncharacterized membrane protein
MKFMAAIMPAMVSTPPFTAPKSTAPDSVVRASQQLTVFGLLALIVLGLAWELALAPTGSRSLALKVLPLCIPLAGLLRHRLYTYRWLSLLIWVYFTEGLVRATSEHGIGQALALIEVALCLVIFSGCSLQVWWRLRQAKAAVGA